MVLSLFGALFGPRVPVGYVPTTFVAAIVAGIIFDRFGLSDHVKRVQ